MHVMAAVISEIEAIPIPEDPFVGRGVMCLTDIISIPYPAHSVVPSGCRATYERRLVPGETLQDVEAQLVDACRRADAADTGIGLATTDYRTYTGVTWNEPKWFPGLAARRGPRSRAGCLAWPAQRRPRARAIELSVLH